MKTIEEAKDSLFADYCEKNRDRVFYGFRSARYLHFRAGFDAAVNHIMSLPLADRLTAEEREQIKDIFWSALKDWIGVGDARGHCKTATVLESIFGKELFAEEGGSDEKE